MFKTISLKLHLKLQYSPNLKENSLKVILFQIIIICKFNF